MLKLKRIELQGFKSFADRSELRFHGQGIAAVVGPNGCGKSNLADAINWVIGEQSAKTLRGARMEDVIFAGTRDRKPVGLASVTMTLVDPGGLELAAFDLAAAPRGQHERPCQRSRQWPRQRACEWAGERPRQWSCEWPCQGRARDHHHPPPVPVRRKRIPDRRQHRAAPRHSGPLHGHRPRSGVATPSSSRAASARLLSSRPQTAARHRRSRRHRQVQEPQPARRGEARRRQAELSSACSTSSKKSGAR